MSGCILVYKQASCFVGGERNNDRHSKNIVRETCRAVSEEIKWLYSLPSPYIFEIVYAYIFQSVY